MGFIPENQVVSSQDLASLKMEIAFLKGQLASITEERDYLRKRLEQIERYLLNKLNNVTEEE